MLFLNIFLKFSDIFITENVSDFIKEEEDSKENLYYFYTTKSTITEYD